MLFSVFPDAMLSGKVDVNPQNKGCGFCYMPEIKFGNTVRN